MADASPSAELPGWVKPVGWLISTVGVPTFLLLWFAGAFDGFLPSPVHAALEKHSRETSTIQRLICEGVWKGNDFKQGECNK